MPPISTAWRARACRVSAAPIGRWSPWGVLLGSLLFGVASALQFQFQATAIRIPYQVFLMLPYLLTLAALLLPAGVARAPLALGARYERD